MIILILYAFTISLFIYGLIVLPKTKIETNLHQQKFSIVIPFRNEQENLDALLESIHRLNYPTNYFEILLINDESTDNSVHIVQKWQNQISNLTLLQNKRISLSPKKDAIQVGIKASKFDWILTTDADCMVPENWLSAYNTIIQNQQSLFVAGPIKLKTNNTLVQQYQKLDCLSLLGATLGSFGIGKPIMCNAANMGFEKQAYLSINNASQKNITSGDDVFTLENFVKKHHQQTHYLNTPEALVTTHAENNWRQVIAQRIRWAAKSTHYKSVFTKFVGLIILLIQINIILGLFLKPITFSFIWLLKMVFDYILIVITSEKTDQKVSVFYFFITSTLYPFLNTYIGIRALFGGYTWKNRVFKK